jgi:potassium-transporting ATPase potassium-binding subunit
MYLITPVIMIIIASLLSYPLGKWMTSMLDNSRSISPKILGTSLSALDQDWKSYSLSLLLFNGCSFLFVWIVLSLQQILPLNPDHLGRISPSLIFHTVSSFVANTNQQHYSGESTMSYTSQIFGLMWLQFVSAGTGISAMLAASRALAGRHSMGNFHVDLRHTVLYVLLPIAFIEAVLLLIAGSPMTFQGSAHATTLEGIAQTIARGPVAAFVAIKQLGTNGGGFFGANSAHPFENPNFVSNWIECLSIILLPMACVWVFGRITGRMKHAAILFGVMLLLFIGFISFGAYFEHQPASVTQGLSIAHSPNLEGKELRFGSTASASWAISTTATSNGSVNSMHDSLNPLTGLIALIGMWINSVFGGVGVGMLNMLIYIIIGVFICGMMVGRSPEYLTRKVETKEMRLALLALLLHPLLILVGTAWFCYNDWGLSSINNPGAHGFSEILYEFSSASANNGSGFEGLKDNTAAWNVVAGIVMLLARFIPIILPLMIAGSLSAKQAVPETKGTFRTDTLLFGIILLGSILFIGALLFLPVAILGPVAEFLGRV